MQGQASVSRGESIATDDVRRDLQRICAPAQMSDYEDYLSLLYFGAWLFSPTKKGEIFSIYVISYRITYETAPT